LFNLPGNEVLALDTSVFSGSHFLRNEGKLYAHIKDGPAQEQLENKLLAQALALNPKTQSYRARLDIQRDLLSKNKARYFPSVGLKASLNFSDWLEEQGTFEEENSSWSVAGIVNIPIFLGTDRLRERAKLKAGLSELEYRRDESSLEVMRDVQTNIHRFIAAANKVTPAAQSKKRSLKALDIVVPAYGNGDTPLINLLDAQSNGLEAELATINARYSYYEAMARLVHGVGWTVHDNYSSFQQEFHSHIEN
ncbi:MAG: TolC family protein, partial [candidate division Zixibacteria bacterium]